MHLQKAVLDSLRLFNKSEDHRLYTIAEFNHYCLFPILHNKARLFYDQDKPVGFVSWAWLTAEETEEFLSERWIPEEEVYQRPDIINDQYQLWGIEFIAPYGHTTKVMRGMAKYTRATLGEKFPVHWRRLQQPDKIHMKEL